MASESALSKALARSPEPWEIECIESIDSTNLELWRRYAGSERAPRLVLWSEEQTAGKGRLDRKWTSVPGLDITASVVFPSPADQSDVPKLSLVAGLALVQVLEKHFELASQVRWPNDVLTERGKLAGILSSFLPEPNAVICGIGINVNSDPGAVQLGPYAVRTTMKAELGLSVEREFLYAQWLMAFQDKWALARSERFDELREAFDAASFYRGRRVRVLVGAGSNPDDEADSERFEGTAGSLDRSGSLIIHQPDGDEYCVSVEDVLSPLD